MATDTLQFTERDLDILRFINDFGFCEMPHIDKRFGLKKPRNYQIMKRLTDGGLVRHERVFHGRHGIYRLSQKGADMTGMPPLARVPVGIYEHETTLIEVYLKLREKLKDARWVSARQLKQEKFGDGVVGKYGHLSDGMFVLPDGKQIAIEVELTQKGRHRTEKILKWYGSQFAVKEVWYYCHCAIVDHMRHMAEKMQFIKIFTLEELFNEPEG